VFPLLQILCLVNLSCPHPSAKGGADEAGSAFLRELRHLNLSPYPSREGRSSLPGCNVQLRAKWVVRVKGSGSGMGGGRMKLNSDGVDVSFKPRSPS